MKVFVFLLRFQWSFFLLHCRDFMISWYWNAFRIIGFVRETAGYRCCTLTKGQLCGVMMFCVASRKNLLNKLLCYRDFRRNDTHNTVISCFPPEPPKFISYPEQSLDGKVVEFKCHVRFGAPKKGVFFAQQNKPRIKAFVNQIIHEAKETISTEGVPGSTFWEIEQVNG